MQVGWARFSSSSLWRGSYLQQWRQLKPIAAAWLAATRKPPVSVHHRAALCTIKWQVRGPERPKPIIYQATQRPEKQFA